MSVHSPDAERAFRIFEALREEERTPPCCEFVEGQILHSGLDTSPCCERCSFQLLKKKRSRSNVYVCRQHARVHRCGLECKRKVSVPCKYFFLIFIFFTPDPLNKDFKPRGLELPLDWRGHWAVFVWGRGRCAPLVSLGRTRNNTVKNTKAGSNQSRTRNNGVSQATYQGEDKSGERERKKQERDMEALGEVCDVCSG